MPLAKGSTADVCRLIGRKRRYVLRILRHRSPHCALDIECHLRRELKAKGFAVAAPLMSSLEVGELPSARAWVLDEFIPGSHPARGRIPIQASRKLGSLLKALHTLPAVGFGKPGRLQDATIVADETQPIDGVSARFHNPLPQDDAALRAHPLIVAAPNLALFVGEALARIGTRLAERRTAVCHTDLHERQILCAGNELAALLDFGDASLLDPNWDLGSIYYFHGDATLKEVVRGYTRNTDQAAELSVDAQLFSIGIAMHHASRALLPGKAHRRQVALDHVERCYRTGFGVWPG